MGDLAGLEIGVASKKAQGTYRPDRNFVDLLHSKGRIGQKSGAGYYRYDKQVGGGRVPLPDPELGVLLREHRARMPICGSNPGLLTLGMCMYAHRSPPPEVGRYA